MPWYIMIYKKAHKKQNTDCLLLPHAQWKYEKHKNDHQKRILTNEEKYACTWVYALKEMNLHSLVFPRFQLAWPNSGFAKSLLEPYRNGLSFQIKCFPYIKPTCVMNLLSKQSGLLVSRRQWHPEPHMCESGALPLSYMASAETAMPLQTGGCGQWQIHPRVYVEVSLSRLSVQVFSFITSPST